MASLLFLATALFVALSIGVLEVEEYLSQKREDRSLQFSIRHHILRKRK